MSVASTLENSTVLCPHQFDRQCVISLISVNFLSWEYNEAHYRANEHYQENTDRCRMCSGLQQLNAQIEDLPIFSNRVKHALLHREIHTIYELLITPAPELARITNFGCKCFEELQDTFAEIIVNDSWEKLGIDISRWNSVDVPTTDKSAQLDSLFHSEAISHQMLENQTSELYEGILAEHYDMSQDDEKSDMLDAQLSITNVLGNFLALKTKIPTRNIDIFRHRSGLTEAGAMTLEQVGNIFGISRERVRQICKKTLARVIRNTPEYRAAKKELYEIFSSFTPSQNLRLLFDILWPQCGKSCIVFLARVLFGNASFESLELAGTRYRTEYKRLHPSPSEIKHLERDSQRIEEAICFPGARISHCESILTWPACRKINFENGCATGVLTVTKAARPLQYESDLERKLLLKLEQCPLVKEINVQCLEIPYTANGNLHRYYPDIVVKTTSDDIIIIEGKPLLYVALYQNILKYRALHLYCRKHNLGYAVMDDRLNSLNDLLHASICPELPTAIRNACQRQTVLHWSEVKVLCAQYAEPITSKLLAAIVFKEHLKMRFAPFTLTLQP